MKKTLFACFFVAHAINICAQDKLLLAKITTDNKRTMIANQSANEIDEDVRQKLLLAQSKTKELFDIVEKRGLIVAGKSESELRTEIVKLAKEVFGMEEHWHKKIVRACVNTLQKY